jgi:D-cysteine desulfhydrase family pyridoxal phosphate-dependent enzyme
LSAALGGPQIWIKRDDQTGLAFGGNKARKLEFSLAEAQAVGAKTLITVGGIQSNHCRQTAALAAKFGLGCILVLNGTAPDELTGNLLLDDLFGAQIVWCKRDTRGETLRKTFDAAWEAGRRPYLIPLGASNAVGTMGYYFAFEEMQQQGIAPDWIVIASSSGGTQAGLVLGAKAHNFSGKILGISIDHTVDELQQTVAGLANEAADKFNLNLRIETQEVLVNADFLGQGYAVMGSPEMEAIRLFAEKEGIVLDPVYTGRAAAGLIALVRSGFFSPQEKVLFWHTGGGPALFAAPYTTQLSE